MNDRLKSAVRVVDVRRAGVERRLRDLRRSQAVTMQQIALLEQRYEKLERKLESNCPVPNTMISVQALITLADESRRLRREIEGQKTEHAGLRIELKSIDASCRSEARKLLALQYKSEFLVQRQQRARHKRSRRNADGID